MESKQTYGEGCILTAQDFVHLKIRKRLRTNFREEISE
jgi:hypothetical protein